MNEAICRDKTPVANRQNHPHMTQFTINDLLLFLVWACVTVALVALEPLPIALAATFCMVAFVAITTLLSVLLSRKSGNLQPAANSRSLRPLRVLALTIVILTWSFSLVPTLNYVVQNHTGDAIRLIIIAVILTPISTWRILGFARSFEGDNGQ